MNQKETVMYNNYIVRKARLNDLSSIIALLIEDDLGQLRESSFIEMNEHYLNAFHKIDSDINQHLMVIESNTEIIATSHLTIMPSLTFKGSTRMQIEAVRVAEKYRGQKIGHFMFEQAIVYAKQHEVKIIQLTTNKHRLKAKNFYEQLGFQSTHEGMKLYL